MNPLRSALIPLALVFAAVLAFACGDDGDSSGADTAPTSPPQVLASATPPSSASDPPTATCGSGGSGIGAIQRTGQREFSSPPARVIDTQKAYTATIQTNKGDIQLLLAAADVPNHVNNFVFLACTGYYDGLTFHRVVLEPQPFVIQGGDPMGNGRGGPGYQINLEISPKWRHETGALGMARSQDPNSAGSQFYITLSPQPALDGGYTVFGRVIAGMDVVNQVRQGDVTTRIDIQEH